MKIVGIFMIFKDYLRENSLIDFLPINFNLLKSIYPCKTPRFFPRFSSILLSIFVVFFNKEYDLPKHP